MNSPSIEVRRVKKYYRTQRGGRVLLGKRGLSDWIRGKRSTRSTVLEDIDFTVNSGEAFGIIGANGSGKSTLLKLISGVTVPSEGEVQVRGRVASLLELGAGFHPMLTGRENIYLNAGILGLSHAEVDEVFEDIVDFSGIRESVDRPVDTYSSGMYVRLGFAVAVHSNPDIFLIDEVLAVGDEAFQRQCQGRIAALIEQGKTLIFVSHDLDLVHSLCSRVLLLNEGRVVLDDRPDKVIEHYLEHIVEGDIYEGTPPPSYTVESGALSATFSEGEIRLTFNGRAITQGLHVYASVLVHRMWHDSTKLRWESHASLPEGGYRFVGCSRRFPYSLIWEVAPAEDGCLKLTIWIETTRALTLQEFHTSVCLPTQYTHWATAHESEDFAPLTPSHSDWQHLNSDYTPSNYLTATSDTAPTVRLEATMDLSESPLRMTPLNTDFHENTRVLQALRAGEEKALHFPPGRHLYFAGHLRVNN